MVDDKRRALGEDGSWARLESCMICTEDFGLDSVGKGKLLKNF